MLKIINKNKYYVVDLNGNVIYILNQKSLAYFLKKTNPKWDDGSIASVINVTTYQPSITINLITGRVA